MKTLGIGGMCLFIGNLLVTPLANSQSSLPPMPTSSNIVQVVWTNEFPKYTPAPPKIAKFSFYDDNGIMFDTTLSNLIFATYQYDYVLEVKTDLNSPWVSYGVVTPGILNIEDVVKQNDSGFFRIRKKKLPHPPYGMWYMPTNIVSVGKGKPKGYFVK